MASAFDPGPNPLGPIVAVDRRPLFRAGLARLAGDAAGSRVIAAASLCDAASALASSGSTPRALLLGLRRGEDPAALVREALSFGVPVICLVDAEEDGVVQAALAAGASGHLVVRDAAALSLRATLHGIESGDLVAAPGDGTIGDHLVGTPARVTERSLEVLGSLADGLHDHEIASRLGISTSAVRKHIASAQVRLGARTRTQAVATAARAGLL